MKLSQHFTLEEAIYSETATRSGINNAPTIEQRRVLKETAEKLEEVRALLGYPMYISSWLRTLPLNRLVGSSDNSDHVKGYAIDFKCEGFGTPKQVCIAIKKSAIKFDQLIFENSWTHISFAPRMRQQVLTAIFTKGRPTKYIQGIL